MVSKDYQLWEREGLRYVLQCGDFDVKNCTKMWVFHDEILLLGHELMENIGKIDKGEVRWQKVQFNQL